MQFINNWSRPVTLAAGADSLALDLPDGEYRLTLADSQFSASAWEIIGAQVSGGTASISRGLEGTAVQDWPAGSVIYCAITAGGLNEILGRLANLEQNSAQQAQAIATLEARVSALEPGVGIIVTSPNADAMGYSAFNSFGDINPLGASVYPDGRITNGEVGEVTELAWSSDNPYYGALQLRVRGTTDDWPSPASLPFETLTIGASTFQKSDLSAAGVGDDDVVFAWYGATGPFVAGDNAVTFA